MKTKQIVSRAVSYLQAFWRDKERVWRLVGIVAVMAVYLGFSFQNINTTLNHVTDDVAGLGSVAAQDWNSHGWLNMKFGVHLSLDVSQAVYTHHPQFFVLPTAIFYKLFGVSEMTTRLGLLSLMFMALIFFYFALCKIFKNSLAPFLILLSWVLMPGAIYYGKSFEITVFSIPTALASFSFSIFYLHSEGKKQRNYLILFWLSMVAGCLFAWFYYVFAAAFWFFILAFKAARKIPRRRQFLIFMPILLATMFLVNLLHFYILKGPGFWADLTGAFGVRSSSAEPFFHWLSFIVTSRGELNYTWLFLSTSFLGMVWYFVDIFRKKMPEEEQWLVVFLFSGLALAYQFYQWFTHPFGVIMFLPAVAIFSGYLFYRLIAVFKSAGIFLVVLSLGIGLVLSINNLDTFYNKFFILGNNDILLLKQLKGKVADNEVCLGESQIGIDFGQIVEWYLHKSISLPTDSRCQKLLVFRGGVTKAFFDEKANLYVGMGYKNIVECGDYWCLAERK